MIFGSTEFIKGLQADCFHDIIKPEFYQSKSREFCIFLWSCAKILYITEYGWMYVNNEKLPMNNEYTYIYIYIYIYFVRF